MDKLLLVFVVAICSFNPVSVVAFSEESEWTHELTLDPFGNFIVRWYIQQDNENNSGDSWIYFEMRCRTKGYVALGFSPMKGSMAGADIYVGWVDKSGVGHIIDYFAVSNDNPIQDRKQDAELLQAEETPGGTKIKFRRRLDTCDLHDFVIAEDTMHLIWASGLEDPIEFNGIYRLHYHGMDPSKHGTHTTFLKTVGNRRKLPDEEQMYPSGTTHFDITLSNIRIPDLETYFHCKILRFPPEAIGGRVIGYRSLMTSQEKFQGPQKVTLYKCLHDVQADVESSLISSYLTRNMSRILERHVDHPGQDCFPPKGPPEWAKLCSEIVITFGINGGEGILFPEHLIMTLEDTPGQFYRLEVHYENPNGEFMVDESTGLRIFYTKPASRIDDHLKQPPPPNKELFEVGAFVAGFRHTPFLTIPPRQMEFSVFGLCSGECLRQYTSEESLNNEGIKVFAVLLRAHLQVRRIILRHIRKGQELQPIIQDNNIFHGYQQYRILPKEVRILPGDDLIVECTYNTIRNSTFIFGGLSLRREICEAVLLYYPKMALTDCRSQPELYQYLGALGVMNVTGDLLKKLKLPLESLMSYPRKGLMVDDSIVLEGGHVDRITSDVFSHLVISKPEGIRNRVLQDHIHTLQWSDDFFSKLVEQKWRVGPHYMHCIAGDGKYLQNKMVVGFPKYLEFVGHIDDSMCMRQYKEQSKANKIHSSFLVFSFTFLSILSL